uniref:Uncharacterized protein n=1 Tax=Aureoumbra lagunensis TaxID=44058 RepID=A0A7S3K0I4_9STRA
MFAIAAFPPNLSIIREQCYPILTICEAQVPGRHCRLYAALARSLDVRSACIALDRLEIKLKSAAMTGDRYSISTLEVLWTASGRAGIQACMLCNQVVQDQNNAQIIEATATLLAAALSAWRRTTIKDVTIDVAAITTTLNTLITRAEEEEQLIIANSVLGKDSKSKALAKAGAIIIEAAIKALETPFAMRWSRTFFHIACIALRIHPSINSCKAVSICARTLGPPDQPLILRRLVANLISILLECLSPIDDKEEKEDKEQALNSTSSSKRRRRRRTESSSTNNLRETDVLLLAESDLFASACNALRDIILNLSADLPMNSRLMVDGLAAHLFLITSKLFPEYAAVAALSFATSTLITPNANAHRSDLVANAKQATQHDTPDRPQLDAALANLRCIIDSLLRPSVPNSADWQQSHTCENQPFSSSQLIPSPQEFMISEKQAQTTSVYMDTTEDVSSHPKEPDYEILQKEEVRFTAVGHEELTKNVVEDAMASTIPLPDNNVPLAEDISENIAKDDNVPLAEDNSENKAKDNDDDDDDSFPDIVV